MSAIDDIITGIGGVIEQITETTAATHAVLQEAEQALDTAEALGANAAVEGLSAVKEQLETLIGQIGSVNTAAEDVQSTAQSVADST